MLLSMLFVYGIQYYMDADTYSLVCVCVQGLLWVCLFWG
jgi:hypothetical protein